MKGTTVVVVALPFVIAFGLSASFAVSRSAGYEGWFGVPGRSQAEPQAQPVPEPEKPTLETLEKDLSLENEQRARFHCFRNYCHGELGACRGKIAEAQAELNAAILAEPTDLARIEEARRNLLNVYEECSREIVDNLLDLKDVLDSEQMKKVADAFFPGDSPEGEGCGDGPCNGRCGHRESKD
jgi:Spy/CpxP family protein refolding chaperone